MTGKKRVNLDGWDTVMPGNQDFLNSGYLDAEISGYHESRDGLDRSQLRLATMMLSRSLSRLSRTLPVPSATHDIGSSAK